MDAQNWLVTDSGQCRELELPPRDCDWVSPYRLYRLLTELEDILRDTDDNVRRLQRLCPLVRQFLNDSPWLPLQYILAEPDPDRGWSVSMLYDETDYPLTVQMVTWNPGIVSPVHNHATWGLVALLHGSEKNTFWRRSPDSDAPDRIESTGDRILEPGEIITFLPDAIHCVEALGDEPTVSFNLYGETDYSRRFEFDPAAQTAKLF